MKVASTVLNGGHGETVETAPCAYPTQGDAPCRSAVPPLAGSCRGSPGRGRGGEGGLDEGLQGVSAWDIPGALLLEEKLRKAQVHERASLKAPPGL